MHHKLQPDRVVCTINHMSHAFSPPTFLEHQFLGFLQIKGQRTWGVNLGENNYAAVHVFYTMPGFYWNDDPRDTLECATANPCVLMFLGCDNTSYMLRFKTKDAAVAYWSKLTAVEWTDKLLFYNS